MKIECVLAIAIALIPSTSFAHSDNLNYPACLIGQAAISFVLNREYNHQSDPDNDANKALKVAYKKCAGVPHLQFDSGMDDIVYHSVRIP